MDELAALNNAHATYDDLLVYGDPVPPLNFPEPEMHPAARVSATLFHREENRLFEAPNVVYRDGDEIPQFAYWIQRKLKKAIYGCVRSCMVSWKMIFIESQYVMLRRSIDVLSCHFTFASRS